MNFENFVIGNSYDGCRMMEGVLDLYLFDMFKSLEKAVEAPDNFDEKDENLVFCASCNAPISSNSCRIEIHGSFEHQFCNPAGIEFRIGCFSTAPGCTHHGKPTLQYSWFAGYTWCYAVCRKCHSHLGWHYSGPGAGFYGLILNRLRFQ